MFLPLILLVVVMFIMTRSAKRKQQTAQNMRNQMQPGTGVRTIGGMYATVKSVGDDAVLLEVAPGVHATYAKNAVGAVIDDEEFARVTEGALGTGLPDGFTTDDVPEDASELDEYAYEVDEDETEDAEAEDGKAAKVDMSKSESAEDAADADADEESGPAKADAEAESGEKSDATEDEAESDKAAKAGKADLRKGGK